ncbi:MAG TPA: CHAP domain-containing protein, partial [Streptosporangiaceae bacterium]|nr:CHAP domain-containing protein [Streptosporangiaceae bacterium]
MLIRCRFAAAVAACATMTGAAMAASPQLAAASARPHAPVTRLALTGAQQRQLVRLYAAYRHIPADDIATILPGSVRGARITRTGVDWASLGLLPSAHAPRAVQTGFQDGGGSGIFTRAPGGMWKVTGLGGEPFGCATAIPAPVRQAWHLAGCAASGSPPPAPARSADGTMSGLANLALKQVGVSDTPPDPSGEEATDCDPYTAIENPAAPTAGCGVDPTFHIQDAAEFWCADFTKWVWTHAGVTSGLGTLSPQSATWYTWGKDHGESMPENQDPSTAQVGDAVVFYPGTTPNGTYADHVGIVVKVNSDGTLDLVDGDFFGDGTYSVQYNETTADLYTWADEVFGHSDEDWIFVSPQLAGSGGGVSAASPAVYNPGSSHLEVYGTGTSGALEESYYRTGTGPGTG